MLVRMRFASLLCLMVVGCARGPSDGASRAASSAADRDAASPDTSARGTAVPWPAALPAPVMPAPGPIKVVGFPADLKTCLPDPAENAGFTRDGAELGYCVHGMSTKCELVDRAGTTRIMTSRRNDDSPDSDPAKERVINAFLKESKLPALARKGCLLRPPPLTGTWAYPDIVVDVAPIAPTYKKGPASAEDELVSQPSVRVGGAVDEDPPVHPLVYAAPHHEMSPPAKGEIPFHVVELNALALSPDGKELGIVTHAFCMEWCDELQVARMPTSGFASLVYNDAGYRAYQKNQLDRAAELFLRAAFVDPTRELPAYNLACVYARKRDKKAEAALELAVGRGGDAIRARAAKDKDFDAVRSEPWFTRLTASR